MLITSGVVKHHGNYFFVLFCLAGGTLMVHNAQHIHGLSPCIIVSDKNARATPKQLVHGLQIQSS